MDDATLDAIERVMECRTRYQEIQPTGTIDPVCSEHGWLWPEGRAHCNKWSDERIALVAEVRRLRDALDLVTTMHNRVVAAQPGRTPNGHRWT